MVVKIVKSLKKVVGFVFENADNLLSRDGRRRRVGDHWMEIR